MLLGVNTFLWFVEKNEEDETRSHSREWKQTQAPDPGAEECPALDG